MVTRLGFSVTGFDRRNGRGGRRSPIPLRMRGDFGGFPQAGAGAVSDREAETAGGAEKALGPSVSFDAHGQGGRDALQSWFGSSTGFDIFLVSRPDGMLRYARPPSPPFLATAHGHTAALTCRPRQEN